MKHFLAIALSILTCCGYGQQFMINRVKDTVEYNSTFTIDKETGDTSFVNDCEHFEKVNGEIINRIDKDGVKQGNWVICDSVTGCEKGRFKNGKRKGIWQKMNKNGTLLKEWEEVTFNKIPIVVKEIDYSSGKGITVIDKPFLSFFLKKLILILIIILAIVMGRVYLNSKIYNIEDDTDYVPFFLYSQKGHLKHNLKHSLRCAFSWWFFRYKKENKTAVYISNFLSVIFWGIIITIVIGLMKDMPLS